MNSTGQLHVVTNSNGDKLTLTHYVGNATSGSLQPSPVILAHGTFSNHRSVRGIAQHLSDHGFHCWILDFQGHGHSAKPAQAPSFESMCLDDTEAAVTYLQSYYPDTSLNWVGHSGGGLAPLMYLARKPEHQVSFNAIVTLASQATHAAVSIQNRWAIRIARMITAALGVAPGKYFKLGPENEFASVMSQWYRWSLSNDWKGDDNFDYLAALATVRLPCLMLAGSDDRFIAPADGCKALFNLIRSNDKEFRLCGTHTGFTENYNHARLVSSRNASKEIWPLISSWLIARQPT